MIRIVMDTNVLISAIGFGGKPRMVLENVIRGTVELFISRPILDEMAGGLSGRKFNYDTGIVNLIMAEIESLAKVVYARGTIKHIIEDPDDDRVLECAIAANADYIISGDRHLLDVVEYFKIKILSAAEFIDTIT